MHVVHVLYRAQLIQRASIIIQLVLNRASSACPLDKAYSWRILPWRCTLIDSLPGPADRVEHLISQRTAGPCIPRFIAALYSTGEVEYN